MTNQNSKKIFTGLTLTILGIGLFWFSPVFAQDNLVVEFERIPLFDEANFLPGETVTRWADVTNNSGETKKIGLEIINNSLCSGTCLSDVLDLVINEDGNPLPLYSGSLTTFYEAGEKVLSDLGIGMTTRYYFSMTFNPDTGDDYQDTTTDFDIKIGFFGEESIGEEITPGGGRGGGRIIVAGLTIFDENALDITVNETTITWETNLDSTSRVIYSPEGFPHLLQLSNPPNYGYVFSTDEDLDKVINHSIIITNLLPGTTYYFRCVSHGSLAVSTEHSFTTLGIRETGARAEERGVPPGETEEPEEGVSEEEGLPFEAGWEEVGEEEEPKTGLGKLLAAIGGFFNSENLCWLFSLLIIIVISLFLLSKKKKEEEEKKKWWVLPLVIVILIILYCFFCPYCWILILVTVILFILFLLLRKKKKEE